MHKGLKPHKGGYFNPTPAINDGAICLFFAKFIAIPARRDVDPMNPNSCGILTLSYSLSTII